MFTNGPQPLKGRGSHIDPPNRFTSLRVEDDWEHLEGDEDCAEFSSTVRTEYFVDDSQSIVTRNDSPDVPFNYSINPYRGCAHGCSYCYARPSHEYLDLSAGLDFETKIFVKEQAPDLFRAWLQRPQWQPEPIMFSGVTDCYQPIERQLQLTRRCLLVAAEACQPLNMITKNALITRDLDILGPMAKQRLVSVGISLTSLDQSLTKVMEPRTSSPAARLDAIARLAAAGVPVRVMIAPIIPGLNDHEVPAVLQAARAAGACAAGYVLLRLPWSVKPVFWEWLERTFPDRRPRIESLVRATRDGQEYQTDWGERQRGTGPVAENIRRTFAIFVKKYGLDQDQEALDCTRFRPPRPTSGQMSLF